MKIAYLAGSYLPSRGADSVHVMRMCQAFARLGHEVTLHARLGDEDARDDFEFYSIENCFRIVKHPRPQVRGVGALVYAASVRYLLGREDVDLLYARDVYALSAASRMGVPFLFESHWRPKHFVQREVERDLFAQPAFRGAVFISKALEELYADVFPSLEASKRLVAHDGADAIDLPPDEPPAKRLQVGYVGSFHPGAGIEMIARLAERLNDVDFHVVGGAPEKVSAWRSQTAKLDNLRFHGFVAPSKLQQMYPTLEVMLATYQPDTPHIRWISPMKLFEYMSHAKPIVCSDFPVMREILGEAEGLLVEPTSLDAWAQALESLRDVNRRRAFGRAGRARLESEFTWLKRAERLVDFARIPS